MNFDRYKIQCPNCGLNMKQGGAHIGGGNVTEWRSCECGIHMCIFTLKEHEEAILRRQKDTD
jgi:hypothetical protein